MRDYYAEEIENKVGIPSRDYYAEEIGSSKDEPSFWKDVVGKTASDVWEGIKATPETAATLATGLTTFPLSVIGGVAKAVTTGKGSKGLKTQRQIAEAFTYQPKSEMAQKSVELAMSPFEYGYEIPKEFYVDKIEKVFGAETAASSSLALDALLLLLPAKFKSMWKKAKAKGVSAADWTSLNTQDMIQKFETGKAKKVGEPLKTPPEVFERSKSPFYGEKVSSVDELPVEPVEVITREAIRKQKLEKEIEAAQIARERELEGKLGPTVGGKRAGEPLFDEPLIGSTRMTGKTTGTLGEPSIIKTGVPDNFKGSISAIEFGKQATPDQVIRLRIKHKESTEKFLKLRDEAEANRTPENLQAMEREGSRNQFLNEAIKSSEGAEHLGERRVDIGKRKKVSEMTPEEREHALLTDRLTGLKNKRAYEELERQPVQALIDVDGLKYVNDTFGHEAGNELLRKVGNALNEAAGEGKNTYHFHGDEFALEGKSALEIDSIVEKARKTLKENPLEINGNTHIPDFSYGVGETMSKADSLMQKNKIERRATGQAAKRGEAEPQLVIIQHNGKSYRVVRKPTESNDAGQWEYLYKGEWKDVISRQIRLDLNKKLSSKLEPLAQEARKSQAVKDASRSLKSEFGIEILGGIEKPRGLTGKDIDVVLKVDDLSKLEGKRLLSSQLGISGKPIDVFVTDGKRVLVGEQVSPQQIQFTEKPSGLKNKLTISKDTLDLINAQAKPTGEGEMPFREAPGAKLIGTTETPSDIVQLAQSLESLNSPKLPIMDRVKTAVAISDKLSTAKDTLGKGLDKISLIGKTLYEDARTGELGAPKVTDFSRARDDYIGAYQISNFEARQFGAEIRKQMPNPLRREAIVNYIKAGGDEATLKKWYDASLVDANGKGTKRYAKGYETAMNLTESEKIFAGNVSNYFDSKLQQLIDRGMLEAGVDNYINQIWLKENSVTKKLKADIAMGRLQPNPSILKKRILESYFEGEQLGFKPAFKDVGYLLTIYDQSFNKALASRNFIKSLYDINASDGNPLVEISGSAKTVIGEWGGKETKSFFVKARAKPVDTELYKPIDHPALRKWKQVAWDSKGNPIYSQGDMLVHPEFYTKLNNILKTSAIRQNPIGRAVLSGVSTMKGTLLSMSGFHQTHVGLHAIFHAVNPFNAPKINFADPLQRSAVEHGLIISDYKNMELFYEGMASGGLIGKVPGIGKLLQSYTDYLFTDYIPRLKMKLFTEAYGRNVKRYGKKLTDDQIKDLTAEQSNAAFGEQNYAKMGMNPTFLDALRLMMLAPDFFIARARFAGQSLKPYGREQLMAAIVRGTLGLHIGTRIVNEILNATVSQTPEEQEKKPKWTQPLDRPFSIYIKGEEFVMRSIPGDVYHLLSDPRSFVYYRLNPTLMQPFIKAVTKRDEYGRYMDMEDQVKAFFTSHIPIPFQTKGQKKLWESMLSSLGVSTFQSKTGFERALMEEYSKNIVITSSKDDKKRHRLVNKYADQARDILKSGDKEKGFELDAKISLDIFEGKLYKEDHAKIIEYATEDRIQRYIKSGISAEQVLSVWNKASADEKMHYEPLLAEKLSNLKEKHPERFEKIKNKYQNLF